MSLGREPVHLVCEGLERRAKRKRSLSLILQRHRFEGGEVLFANDGRKGRRWIFTDGKARCQVVAGGAGRARWR